MKRFVSILIALVMTAGLICVPAVTASAISFPIGTLVSFGSYPQS